jgi:CheY-like chemotaxis protein
MPKVLLIEDDRFLRTILEKRLRGEQIKIISAGDGEEALQKVLTEYPDLILLDLILPKRSGFSFLAEINKDVNLKKIPIIVLSNLGQPEDIQRAKEYGVKEYFVKANLSLEQLVKRIKDYMTELAPTK